MLYGFRPPAKNDAFFKVCGELLELRFLDQIARDFLQGAVQSFFKDGARNWYADKLESLTFTVGSAVNYCQRKLLLRPLAWLLGKIAVVLGKEYIRVSGNNFHKCQFVQDAHGNYTLLFSNPGVEHNLRAVISQLGLRIVATYFPEGYVSPPKVERTPGSSATVTTTVDGQTRIVDLYG